MCVALPSALKAIYLIAKIVFYACSSCAHFTFFNDDSIRRLKLLVLCFQRWPRSASKAPTTQTAPAKRQKKLHNPSERHPLCKRKVVRALVICHRSVSPTKRHHFSPPTIVPPSYYCHFPPPTIVPPSYYCFSPPTIVTARSGSKFSCRGRLQTQCLRKIGTAKGCIR
jgi:hypothetical protein